MNWIRVLSLVWALVGVSTVSGQQYPFLPVPGGPKGARVLFQDSKGRLWIAGEELACFDGTRFFVLRDYGFPAVESYDVAEDTSGAIWIAAETGVYRFSNGRFEELSKGVAVSVIAPTPNLAVAAIGPLGRGVPARAQLVRIAREKAKWKTDTLTDLDSPGPLTLDPSGVLLYPCWGGHSEIRLADVIRCRMGEQLAVSRVGSAQRRQLGGSWKMLRDQSGCVWGAAPGWAGYDCGDGWRAPLPRERRTVDHVREGPDGRIALWGNDLLAVGSPGSFQVASRENGSPGIMEALPAFDGTIWLGTTNGLYRFASPFRIEYWTIREGVPDPPWSIAQIGRQMYAGLDRRIIALNHARGRWQTVATFQGSGFVSGLVGAQDGTLFAAFMGGGAAQLRADGTVLATTETDHPRGGNMRLAETPQGEIWMGGSFLGRLTLDRHALKFTNQPLRTTPSGDILAIKYEDHTRKLWSCYNGGVAVRDGAGWKEFTTRDGLLVNGCWSLAPLPNGDVWDAYYGARGLALIRPRSDGRISVRQYGPDSGIPESGSDALDADARGWLWRSGTVGIYVATPAQAESRNWLPLDALDGFPANDINTGSVFADSDGSMWWGADNDLAHYTPRRDLVSPQFAPRVFVSAFSLNNQPPRLAEAVGIVPHGSKVIAHIGSLQFDRRNALRVRYRLLPDSHFWTETKNLDLSLGTLSRGQHTLEIEGRVFTGPWSETVSRSFTVLNPIWLGWPFVTSYFLSAAILTAAGFLLHRSHQADAAQVLPDLAEWRVGALLPDVHDVTGTLLDSRFEVGNLLARGGFANVMRGYDRDQRQPCAVKIFRNEVKDKNWIQRSFDQEVAALQRVQHLNVVTIYAHGRTSSGAPYLVMEFIEGTNLREVIAGCALPAGRAARLLRQLAGALDAIHAQGICHRDLKPENVIVRAAGTADEQAVLIDFSIAIIKDADETLHGLSRAAGTFDYMAPEQAIGYAETSSDVYSLARLLMEVLTGHPLRELLPGAALDLPFRVRELARSLRLGLSDESVNMLARALEFDPGRRPSSATYFARPLVQDLESYRAKVVL